MTPRKPGLDVSNALPPEYRNIPELTPEQKRSATKRVLRYSNDPEVAAPILEQLGLVES